MDLLMLLSRSLSGRLAVAALLGAVLMATQSPAVLAQQAPAGKPVSPLRIVPSPAARQNAGPQLQAAPAVTATPQAVAAPAASGPTTQTVAAVVNDDIVSINDLEQRMRLVILSSNLPDTAEARERISGQVLRKLMEERIQMQEAARIKVRTPPAEISAGIANIERQVEMKRGEMEPFLKARGIDPQTMRAQVEAEITWSRTVRAELSSSLQISEEEIASRLEMLKANLGKPEYLVADIFLAIDQRSREQDVVALANQLIEQLKQGTSFSALARQFSQTGAASGGDLGWVSEGMMDDDLWRALTHLEKNHISLPLRMADGYHILLLRDKRIAGQERNREPVIDVGELFITLLPSNTEQDNVELFQRIRTRLSGAKSCDDMEQRLARMPSVEWAHPGEARPSEMPPEVRETLRPLAPLELSQTLGTGNTRRIFTICSRREATGDLPSREEIQRKLEDERMETLARRLMRDLRRAAYIDIRVKQ